MSSVGRAGELAVVLFGLFQTLQQFFASVDLLFDGRELCERFCDGLARCLFAGGKMMARNTIQLSLQI